MHGQSLFLSDSCRLARQSACLLWGTGTTPSLLRILQRGSQQMKHRRQTANVPHRLVLVLVVEYLEYRSGCKYHIL